MTRGTLLGIVLVAGTAAKADAQTAQIHLLWARGEVSPHGVSADGSMVVGMAREAPAGQTRWFRWSEDAGLEMIGPPLEDMAIDVSGDGLVLVGRSNTIAHLWTEAGGAVSLGPLDADRTRTAAAAASFDGAVVVGEGTGNVPPQGFVWREATGMVSLGGLDGPTGRSSAHDVTADGTVIVGNVEDDLGIRPAAWTETGGWEVLANAPDWSPNASANAVSSDGEYVLGGIRGVGGVAWAFRWTRTTGEFDILEQDITDAGDFQAADISDDGGIVVGAIDHDGTRTRAVIWDPDNGVRLLSDVLEGVHGLDLSDWILYTATAVSRDGRVVAGSCHFDGTNYDVGYVAVLEPPPCLADFNRDGAVNTLDVLAFLNAWTADDPRADVNNDGVFNTQDVLAFLNAWNAGCA